MLKKYITPAAVVAIIMALSGLVYSQMKEKVEKNSVKIEQVRKEKVDNETLRDMIQMQQKLFEAQLKNNEIQNQNTQQQLNQVYDEIKKIKEK